MRFTVEPGHVTAFCRATGEDVPTPGEDVPFAFPCCVRQQDPAHMRGLRQSGPMATLDADGGSVMAASDCYEYLGRVLVGHSYEVDERLGNAWAKTTGSGGTLDFSEHVAEWTDATGGLVLRTTRVLVVVR